MNCFFLSAQLFYHRVYNIPSIFLNVYNDILYGNEQRNIFYSLFFFSFFLYFDYVSMFYKSSRIVLRWLHNSFTRSKNIPDYY